MGVLAGRFPGKVEEGFFEQKRKRLVEAVKGFAAFAENFGLDIAEREVDFWKETSGGKVLNGLENYGVAACDIGTEFWKNYK